MGETPVLLIVFNRPETTRRVFEAIRAYQPRKLFVAADGPRPGSASDTPRCAQVRELVRNVDWPCEVEYRFREENLGCREAPAQAITWFFEHVEEGIILEDDCLPSPDFFRFCSEMLAYYRNDEQIMVIGGSHYFQARASDASYEFSRFALTWGWATWRRAWKKFDLRMPDFEEFKRSGQIRSLLPKHPYMQWRFTRIFQKCHQRAPWFSDVWDWMWFYTILKNGGLCILPNYNMISNIGRVQSTHAMLSETDARSFDMLPEKLKHPSRKAVNEANDRRIFLLVYKGDWKDFIRYGLSKITFKDWM